MAWFLKLCTCKLLRAYQCKALWVHVVIDDSFNKGLNVHKNALHKFAHTSQFLCNLLPTIFNFWFEGCYTSLMHFRFPNYFLVGKLWVFLAKKKNKYFISIENKITFVDARGIPVAESPSIFTKNNMESEKGQKSKLCLY